MASAPTVAIVVPCYEEAARLDRTAFEQFIAATPNVRILLVNDGSRDNTLEVLENIRATAPQSVRVLNLEKNSGKSEAVRQGVLAALDEGTDFVGYWDADLATPLDAVHEFVRVLTQSGSFDIVIGARVALLGRRIDRVPLRHYLGRVFATAASVTLNLAVYDTQCGAKLFRVGPGTRGLFERPFVSRWVFDVELLARYLTTGGLATRLFELPLLCWTDVGDSKVKPLDFVRSLGEMANIYRRYDLRQQLRPVILALTGVFSRYVGVGGLGTVAHYALLILTVELFGLRPQVGTVIGATVGAMVNYVLNYAFTFASRESHRRALPKFAVVALLGVLASGYGVRRAGELGVHYIPAQIVCTLVVLVLGFFVNRAWTFASPTAGARAQARGANDATSPEGGPPP